MTTLITFNKKKKVGVVYFAKRKILRKFSFDKKKYKLIKNEFQGQGWYQSRQKIIFNTPRFITKKSKDYIDLPIILGNKKNFWNYLGENYYEAELTIKHYKKIWPQKKIVPSHGDLTFSNIIFTKNDGPIIIDWENFLVKKMNWGFDLSYFLISTIALPSIFHKDERIKTKELILVEKLWKVAFASKKYKYLNKPVSFLKSNFGITFILRDRYDYFPNLLSKYKIDQINEALKFTF